MLQRGLTILEGPRRTMQEENIERLCQGVAKPEPVFVLRVIPGAPQVKALFDLPRRSSKPGSL